MLPHEQVGVISPHRGHDVPHLGALRAFILLQGNGSGFEGMARAPRRQTVPINGLPLVEPKPEINRPERTDDSAQGEDNPCGHVARPIREYSPMPRLLRFRELVSVGFQGLILLFEFAPARL